MSRLRQTGSREQTGGSEKSGTDRRKPGNIVTSKQLGFS